MVIEWCCICDGVDLDHTWGVIKCLHGEDKVVDRFYDE